MTDDPSSQRQSRRPLPAPSAPPYQIPPPPRVPGTPPPPPKRDSPSTAPPPTPAASVAPPVSTTPVAIPSAPLLPGEATFSPELSLAEQMDELERWAMATQGRLQVETLRVTLIRTLTLACLLGALVTVPLGAVTVAVALGVLAVIGMMLEVAWPGLSSGRSMRKEAVHALRELENTLKIDWDRVRLMVTDPADPKRVEHAL